MKILLATSRAIPTGGGIASYNQELLCALGNNNRLFLLTESNEVNVQGFEQTISSYGHSIFRYQYNKYIIDKINKERFDIIINSNSKQLSIVAPFVNAPIITVAHYFRGIMADESGYNSKYLSKIIVLSKSCKEYLFNKFKISKEKIDIIYNFVADNKSSFNKNKLNNDPLEIIYPGGASIGKSSDVVVEAVYKLLSTKLNFKLYWLGDTLTFASRLSIHGLKRIEDFFQEDKRLIFTGKVDRKEAEKLIGNSNVFILPSRGEGCPMTLLEAMRGGCIPIISDSNHGSLDIIHDSNAGIITKQDNSEDLYSAITDILTNHSKYYDYYFKTYKYSKEVLSRDKWIMQMQNVFSKAIMKEKTTEVLNRYKFYRSLIPFRWLIIKHHFKKNIQIVKYRIKVECLYKRFH